MSMINILQLVLLGAIVLGFASVLLRSISPSLNIRLALAGGIILFVLIVLFSVLPQNAVVILFTGFYLSLTFLAWGFTLRSFTARRRSGAVLLNLSHMGRRSLWLTIALAAFVGGWVLYDYFTNGQVAVDRLAQGIGWLSIATTALLLGQQPMLITARGFYYLDDMTMWDNIKTFEWKTTHDGFNILVLRFKRRGLWSNSVTLRIPSAQKDVVAQLLLQRTAGAG